MSETLYPENHRCTGTHVFRVLRRCVPKVQLAIPKGYHSSYGCKQHFNSPRSPIKPCPCGLSVKSPRLRPARQTNNKENKCIMLMFVIWGQGATTSASLAPRVKGTAVGSHPSLPSVDAVHCCCYRNERCCSACACYA